MTMASIAPKNNAPPAHQEASSSDMVSSREDEKTIPFLRRLRDMLLENEDEISFAPGREGENNRKKTLGRIIVHDRLKVEADILPRYFNHSSFASLRRQLNYFNFVRLGKGRQRESTYINDNVVELEDILHLKRRSTTVARAKREAVGKDHASGSSTTMSLVSSVAPVLDLSKSTNAQESGLLEHRPKRRRATEEPKPTNISPRSTSPLENNLISEDEHSEGKYVALDLTLPDAIADDDVLAGCSALLNLASKVKVWD